MTQRGFGNRRSRRPLSPVQRELLGRARAEREDADEWNRTHPFSPQKDPTSHAPTAMEIRRQQEAGRRQRGVDNFDGHDQSPEGGKKGNDKKHGIRILPNGIKEVY